MPLTDHTLSVLGGGWRWLALEALERLLDGPRRRPS